jgi:hypothetical protein
VVVGDDDRPDVRGVEPVVTDQLQDLRGVGCEARVDQCELRATVDQVGMTVESVREAEGIVAAADEVHVLRESHG